MNFKMHRWSDISSRYTDSALLGNGASIAIEPEFRYPPLYKAAILHGHLGKSEQAIFDFFKTRDFEFILLALSHANAINGHLGILEYSTTDAYEQIKNGLIRTVKEKDVHPSYANVESRLQSVGGFLSKFKTVFSLNYDLLLYWALMLANSKAGGSLIKDCFINGQFVHDYEALRIPHANLPSSTLVFYPHGNLILTKNIYGAETKLQSRSTNLISEITDSWKISGGNPLFVSEGDSQKKLLAIGRSAYLQVAYSELCAHRESILIYGWACGVQDTHILKAIARAGVSRLGISVHTGVGSDSEHFRHEVTRAVQGMRGLEDTEIEFFDSSDPGVWIHPVS